MDLSELITTVNSNLVSLELVGTCLNVKRPLCNQLSVDNTIIHNSYLASTRKGSIVLMYGVRGVRPSRVRFIAAKSEDRFTTVGPPHIIPTKVQQATRRVTSFLFTARAITIIGKYDIDQVLMVFSPETPRAGQTYKKLFNLKEYSSFINEKTGNKCRNMIGTLNQEEVTKASNIDKVLEDFILIDSYYTKIFNKVLNTKSTKEEESQSPYKSTSIQAFVGMLIGTS